jgi:hypothetical protein
MQRMRCWFAMLAAGPLLAQGAAPAANANAPAANATDAAREAQRLVRQLELPDRCSAAWRRLLQIGAPSAPALAAALDDPRPEVAVRAAHVLGLLGARAADALPKLRAARPAAAEPVQHACRWAIAQIGFRGTLLVDWQEKCVLHLDGDGKEVARLANLDGPWHAEPVADGGYLVAELGGNAVRELDAAGKELWKFADGLQHPYDVARLPDGNTLVCDAGHHRVVEVDHAGRTIWEVKDLKHPVHAGRLPDGHTLIADAMAQRVFEVDAEGAVVWERADLDQPMDASRLPDGNTLIACFGKGNGQDGQVLEIAPDGKVAGKPIEIAMAKHAQRLPDGHTLVAASAWVEFDATGKEVWRREGRYPVGIRRQ